MFPLQLGANKRQQELHRPTCHCFLLALENYLQVRMRIPLPKMDGTGPAAVERDTRPAKGLLL